MTTVRDVAARAGVSPATVSRVMGSRVAVSPELAATSDALVKGVEFDAIQAGSDELAMGAIAALHDAGLSVPNDKEIIGFGNVEMSGYLRSALTSLSSNPGEMACHIGDLISADTAAKRACRLIKIERELVRRDSA